MRRPTHARLAAALACAAALAAPAAAQKQPPPAPLPARPLEFPAFRETRLPNGMQLIVVEKHAHPVTDLYLLVRSGEASVTPEKAGTAGILAEVLTKGTSSRSAEQIAEEIESTGGSLQAFSDQDYVGVAATVLADRLPLAFELASDVVLHPSFPESEVQTARTQTLSALQAQLGQPSSLAQRRLSRELYGAHPYGVLETPQTVEAVTQADLRDFHTRHFRPGNAILVVAGDVRAAEVEELARRWFGGWSGGEVPRPAFTTLPTRTGPGITLIHRPGSVQSALRVGFPGIRPDDPDYYPLQVLDKVLGSGTDSRLFQILREAKGWTYGAYSFVTRPADVGFLSAGADVRTEVTDSALVELLAQLRRIADEPVSAAEMEAAKGYLVGSFPVQIETAAQVASQVAITRLLGLPIEALLRYRERISAVTPADVQRVAREHVDPGAARIVVVGDASKVLAMLEPIAPVTLLDIQGNPLDRASLEVRAPTERFDGALVRPATLTYQVQVQGNPVGTQTVTVARDGEGWTRTSAGAMGPLRQTIVTRFGADFSPVAYSESVEGPVTGSATVQVAEGRYRGEARLPAQMGGDRTFDAEAFAGSVFDGTDEVMLSVAELAVGKTITIPVFSTNAGSAGNVTYSVTAAGDVTVPAGTFPAFRVEVTGKQAPLVLWLRQEAPHVVLKYEITGQPVVVVLQSIQ